MAASQTLTPEEFDRWLNALPKQVVPRSFEVPLKKCAIAIKADARKNFEQSRGPNGQSWKPLLFSRPNSKGSDKPLLNTGTLMASVVGNGKGHVETITDANTTLTIGTADYRAFNMQEGVPNAAWDGRPVRAKALAIPLTKDAARVRGPRQFPRPLVLIPRDNKPPLLVEKVAGKGRKGERWIVHYLLVPKVVIPARPFLGFSKQLVIEIDLILLDHCQRYWLQGP